MNGVEGSSKIPHEKLPISPAEQQKITELQGRKWTAVEGAVLKTGLYTLITGVAGAALLFLPILGAAHTHSHSLKNLLGTIALAGKFTLLIGTPAALLTGIMIEEYKAQEKIRKCNQEIADAGNNIDVKARFVELASQLAPNEKLTDLPKEAVMTYASVKACENMAIGLTKALHQTENPNTEMIEIAETSLKSLRDKVAECRQNGTKRVLDAAGSFDKVATELEHAIDQYRPSAT